MDVILKPIFSILTVPDLKIKKPSWITTPSPWTIFTFILLSYFLVTGLPLYLRVSSESLENQMIAMQEESSTT